MSMSMSMNLNNGFFSEFDFDVKEKIGENPEIYVFCSVKNTQPLEEEAQQLHKKLIPFMSRIEMWIIKTHHKTCLSIQIIYGCGKSNEYSELNVCGNTFCSD